jgi:hypothetical protein
MRYLDEPLFTELNITQRCQASSGWMDPSHLLTAIPQY